MPCRNANREAFSGFNVDAVANYTEKQMASLSADFGLDLGTVRGTVNNACRTLEVPSVQHDYRHVLSSNSLVQRVQD
jgi:3-methyladenine DNA glycosylase Tag